MPSTAFQARYLDVLASIYLYNEYRGYTALDRVIEAVRLRCPDDPQFTAEVIRHRADERKHYVMFKRWFELQGRMPLRLDTRFGHIDRFIQWVFGCSIDQLDTGNVVADPAEFERLCRVIMLGSGPINRATRLCAGPDPAAQPPRSCRPGADANLPDRSHG